MSYKNFLVVLTLLFVKQLTYSQNEFSKWYFGNITGLDFSTTPPTVLSNGFGGVGTTGGCATICDNSGNLLFYSNGPQIANSAHTVMANGSGLNSTNGSTQVVIIVKQPGNSNLYFVFTTVATGFLSYHIVDMSLAAGMGSVTVKNATLDIPTCNKIVAVRHCNGDDVWIVSHDANSDKFKSFLLDNNGVNSIPVVSTLGPTSTTISSGIGTVQGFLKVSPDGLKLAMSQFSNSVPTSAGPEGFYLFDFNPANGVVSNSIQLNNYPAAGGVEFSSDGYKLYGALVGSSPSATNSLLFQWNLCAGSNNAILASQYTVSIGTSGSYKSGSLQRAIDDKIYLTVLPSSTSNSYSIGVINNPNALGISMNFVPYGQIVSNSITKMPSGGLPNYINPYIKPTLGPVSQTMACQTVNFSIPTPTYAGACTANTYPINGYLWDFGDASTGSANSSTLTNPSHLFSALGTYTVKTIVYSNCNNDTLISTINITTLSPIVSVTGPTLACKGDKPVYTASGANSFLWNTGATSSSVALALSNTAVYTVTGTSNGCKTSKVFTVTVEPCLGISSTHSNGSWHVYPNPFSNELIVESTSASNVSIFDVDGKKILEQIIDTGTNTLNTENLKAGVYFLKATNEKTEWHARFVKVE